MIIGHQHLINDFKNLVKNGRLAHGYIFFGEPGVGKFYFARHLANLLENGVLDISNRPLSDALIIGDPSTGSGRGGIEEMREIKSFLWQKPVVSSKRLVVINNAENLTPQAQNAILKITEEPPASAVLVLIVNQLENLIPPLLSRLQKIYFGRLSDEEIGNFLQTLESRTAKSDLAGAWGRPGRAFRLLNDSLTKDAEKYANNFLKMKDVSRSALIKELAEAQKEKPELLDRFFESLILQLRKDSVKNLAILQSVLHRFFLIKSYNTNKRLQLEAI